ncbi:MAG TPA: fumarylacetoacetate hydrolase family protein [Ktedonobacterales bacterium]|nr:fumarylacetoacetate hydrolase family protein [Ktedonobacterales bacterium]
MKLVTYVLRPEKVDLEPAELAAGLGPAGLSGRAGVLHGDLMIDLPIAFEWARGNLPGALPRELREGPLPDTLLGLLRLTPDFIQSADQVIDALAALPAEQLLSLEPGLAYPASKGRLRAPIPEPPSVRDFYAFEQHVKTARAKRNLGMIPEWYEIPVFYFSNPAAINGPDDSIAYPKGTEWLDYELEIACVIGKAGKDIPVEEAADYIAGYTIMNDWSARDVQRKEMLMSLGPAKGKDFATSLGPWLVTPDELSVWRSGSGASERYDMTMLARINGAELSRGNFKDIYYSFPQLIAHASRNVWLKPGDVIGSGTVGTGCLLELAPPIPTHPADERPPAPISREQLRWLQRGDVVELEIDGLGVLKNTVV